MDAISELADPMTVSLGLVIPTFNRANQIGVALQSAVGQGFDQIVVVDDGSQDHTEQIVREFPSVDYVRQANSGACAARNAGVALLDTEFVTFLDSDDELLESFVERYVNAAATVDVVTSAFVEELPDGSRCVVPVEQLGPAFANATGQFTHGGTYAVRRSVFTALGGFDESMPAAQHTEFALRLLNADPAPAVAVIKEPLCVYRRARPDGIRSDLDRVGRGALYLTQRHWRVLARDRRRLSNHCAVIAHWSLTAGDTARARRYAWLAWTRRPNLKNTLRMAVAILPGTWSRRVRTLRERGATRSSSM